MPVPFAVPPLLTTAGRYAVPYLIREFAKKGSEKFSTTYGTAALESINSIGAQNPELFNEEFERYTNDVDEGKEEETTGTELSTEVKEKPPELPEEPPKGPDIGTELATEAAVQTTKKLLEDKKPDISKQTKDLVPEKPDFGELTETEIQTAKALMSDQPEFYSRVVKSIKDAKPNKLTKNKWKSFIQGDKEELKFLGLDKFLQGNESITKEDLLDFVEQKNIADKLSVVEVPIGDQYDFSEFSIGGAGGKRAVSTLPYDYAVNPTGQKLQEGYKSTVEQYVFQVDGPTQWSANTSHFPEDYATNAIAHARAQTGYFDADAVEKRLNAKEADGVTLSNDDKVLKSASRQLEDTFIIDEIQSDAIQDIQKKGTFEDHTVIDNHDIVDYLNKNNIEYKILPQEEYGKKSGQPKNEKYKSYIEFKPTGYATKRTIPIVKEKNTRFEIFTKDGEHGESIFGNVNSLDEAIEYFKESGTYGVSGLPITESKKYVELILNAMIKKAVEKNLDSIGITNGQIQFDRYEGQPIEDKEGLKKFYDRIVRKQLEKIANKYGVELETVELPGKAGPKEFDDIGLNEPTERSDAAAITRRTSRAMRDGFVLRTVKYDILANTIENLMRGNIDGDPLPDDPNVVLPDYASIFTEAGRGAGPTIMDALVDDNPDLENPKDYYIWVRPDSGIDKAIARANNDELMSIASAWDIRDINLQMPISSVIPSGGTDINSYNSYISEYYNKRDIDLKYNTHEIIKMKLPKKLKKEILSKPIKLSKAKKQTDKLFA